MYLLIVLLDIYFYQQTLLNTLFATHFHTYQCFPNVFHQSIPGGEKGMNSCVSPLACLYAGGSPVAAGQHVTPAPELPWIWFQVIKIN